MAMSREEEERRFERDNERKPLWCTFQRSCWSRQDNAGESEAGSSNGYEPDPSRAAAAAVTLSKQVF